MLSCEEIERLLDVADEFGISVNEEDVQSVWDKCSQKAGVPKLELPVDGFKLATLLKEAVGA